MQESCGEGGLKGEWPKKEQAAVVCVGCSVKTSSREVEHKSCDLLPSRTFPFQSYLNATHNHTSSNLPREVLADRNS